MYRPSAPGCGAVGGIRRSSLTEHLYLLVVARQGTDSRTGDRDPSAMLTGVGKTARPSFGCNDGASPGHR